MVALFGRSTHHREKERIHDNEMIRHVTKEAKEAIYNDEVFPVCIICPEIDSPLRVRMSKENIQALRCTILSGGTTLRRRWALYLSVFILKQF